MFIGEYNYSVDDKGRLAIPSKFRAALKSGAIITRGLDNCLFVYTKTEWATLAEKLSALPMSRANSRAFSRLMLAGAMDAKLDTQGRVIIPDYLRKFATIGKKVVIAGLFNRLEVWDEDKWNNYKQKTEKDSNDIAEQLGELGI